jgi:hypothetical protein
MLFRFITAAVLICIAHVTPAEELEKAQKDAGRDLRKVFLTTPPEQFDIQPSEDYPRVCGVAMDWPIVKTSRRSFPSPTEVRASTPQARLALSGGLVSRACAQQLRNSSRKRIAFTLTLLQPTTSLIPRPIMSASFLLRSTAYALSRPIYARCKKDEGSTRRSSIWRRMLSASCE